MKKCHDCGVAPGEFHSGGCDVERCPLCKGQAISCDCVYEVNGIRVDSMEETHPEIYGSGATEEMWAKFDAEIAARGLTRDQWTGEWPGVAECRERGWYCQDGHGPSSRWGSFCPCPPDAVDAREDLNRLAYFHATGKDTLYDGCPRVPRDYSMEFDFETMSWRRKE